SGRWRRGRVTSTASSAAGRKSWAPRSRGRTLEGVRPNAVLSGGRSMLTNAAPLLRHVRCLVAASSSDEELLADFLARRSDEAFAALLGRHGPMVLNVCRRILHDAHAAEDVFQATFLVLADRAGSIRRRASLAGFQRPRPCRSDRGQRLV